MDHLLWVTALVLVVSFLSNVSPFVGGSYTLVATIQLVLFGYSPLAFLAIVVTSAAGATLAKVAIYYGAFGLRGFLERNRNIRLIGRYSSTRRFYLVLFVAAVLPVLPLDDFVYIGGGATSAPIVAMTSVTFAAKLVKSGVEISVELAFLDVLQSTLGIHGLLLPALLGVLFVAVGILIYKLDWEEAYRKWWPFKTLGGPGSG